jgi:hypothetical protein
VRPLPTLPLAILAAFSLFTVPASGTLAAQGAEKATATITLRYTLSPSGAAARTVVLKSLGPPPAASTTLVNEDGRTTVQAEVQDPSTTTCRSAPVHDTGLGDDRWCVLLRDVQAASEVTGKLAGAKAVVTLKVAARDGLLFPTAVAVLVLLLAAGFVFYTANLLGERTHRLLVRAQLRRRSGVAGLPEWVEAARDYLTWARIRSLVGWMRDRGQQRATRARASLAAAESDLSLDILPKCPLRKEARDEAARKDVSATQLISFKGEILEHPAAVLEDALRRAEVLIKDFDGKVKALLPRVPSGQKVLAEALVKRTREGLDTVSAADIQTVMPEKLNETISQLRAYIGSGDATAFLATATSSTEPATRTARERLLAAADIVAASWPIVLAIIVLMVVATVAALSVSYAAKRTFGTAWDYAALAVSVFGSTSVAGIVAAALLWRRTQAQT